MKLIRLIIFAGTLTLFDLGNPFFSNILNINSGLNLLFSSQVIAKEKSNISKEARTITVKIIGAVEGSGVLVDKEGDTYTVLTTWHTLEDNRPDEEIGIITFDNKEHIFIKNTIQKIGFTDSAIIKFKSKKSYKITNLGDSKEIEELDEIHIAGFPLRTSNLPKSFFRLKKGNIEMVAGVKIDNGYQLSYSNPTFKGMSGGPIINTNGELIGIHGRTDLNEKLTLQLGKMVTAGTNSGIPIYFYKQFINGDKINRT